MTGGGAPGAPGILRCLKADASLEIVLCDANPNAVGRYLHTDFFTIPKADDPAFIDAVFDESKRRGIDIIMPLVTRELFHFAARKKLFEDAGIKVLVSEKSALDIANDKSLLYKFLQSKNIQVPEFRVVQTLDAFEHAISELGAGGKKVCFKPSVSNGSRGFRIIDDNADAHDLLFNHKPNNTYITKSEIIRILSLRPFPELLVSEYLPGEEFSVDCLANKGNCRLAVPRLRSKMNNGISVEGEFINNASIIEYSEKIISKVGLHGNIGIQVKRSEKDEFLIIEINPRVQGTIVAGLGAGVNLPLLAVRQEFGEQLKEEDMKVKWGTKFTRYWNEVFYN